MCPAEKTRNLLKEKEVKGGMVIDAGVAVGVENIRLATGDGR